MILPPAVSKRKEKLTTRGDSSLSAYRRRDQTYARARAQWALVRLIRGAKVVIKALLLLYFWVLGRMTFSLDYSCNILEAPPGRSVVRGNLYY